MELAICSICGAYYEGIWGSSAPCDKCRALLALEAQMNDAMRRVIDGGIAKLNAVAGNSKTACYRLITRSRKYQSGLVDAILRSDRDGRFGDDLLAVLTIVELGQTAPAYWN